MCGMIIMARVMVLSCLCFLVDACYFDLVDQYNNSKA